MSLRHHRGGDRDYRYTDRHPTDSRFRRYFPPAPVALLTALGLLVYILIGA